MKRIVFSGAIAVISLFSLSSCSTLSRTSASAPFAYTEVHPNEIRADLDFNTSDKIEGTVHVGYLFGVKVSGGREYAEVLSTNNSKSIFGLRGKRIRSMAMAKALEGSDYDMIINPQYETKRNRILFGLWTRYTVTVKGYGKRAKNFKQTDNPSDRRDIPLKRDCSGPLNGKTQIIKNTFIGFFFFPGEAGFCGPPPEKKSAPADPESGGAGWWERWQGGAGLPVHDLPDDDPLPFGMTVDIAGDEAALGNHLQIFALHVLQNTCNQFTPDTLSLEFRGDFRVGEDPVTRTYDVFDDRLLPAQVHFVTPKSGVIDQCVSFLLLHSDRIVKIVGEPLQKWFRNCIFVLR